MTFYRKKYGSTLRADNRVHLRGYLNRRLRARVNVYAPWGNLVFYYGDVGYFSGIVRIGQFGGNIDAIASQTGDFTARIELAK